MDPLKPLGKALSQNPLMGTDVPLSVPPGVAPDQPISAFQWMSLAKATWTWVLRPLWYLCFKWPSQLFLIGMSTPRSKSNWDWRREHDYQQGMKMTEAMTRDARQER
ncbi:hypothetical protein ACMU6081_24485 [Achromobacter mucicolens]|jgi:hypothetical protein|uniref:Uncharacterized protein n=1 Tax=Achromobacter mucicolens TaxID=1389922 RepID=A0ABM8LAE2_9BURK|nr:hypothetical protein LMG3415_01503 [Achromobacter mucicolens]